MTSSQANQWQTHPVTTSSVSAGNSGIANLSQPGMMYPTYQVHIIAPDTHPQSIETGMQGGGGARHCGSLIRTRENIFSLGIRFTSSMSR